MKQYRLKAMGLGALGQHIPRHWERKTIQGDEPDEDITIGVSPIVTLSYARHAGQDLRALGLQVDVITTEYDPHGTDSEF